MTDNIEYVLRKVRWQVSGNVLNDVRIGKSDKEIAIENDIKLEDVTKAIDSLIWLSLKGGALDNDLTSFTVIEISKDLNLPVEQVQLRFNRADYRYTQIRLARVL